MPCLLLAEPRRKMLNYTTLFSRPTRVYVGLCFVDSDWYQGNCKLFHFSAPKANVGLSVQETGPEVTGEQGKVAGDGVCG